MDEGLEPCDLACICRFCSIAERALQARVSLLPQDRLDPGTKLNLVTYSHQPLKEFRQLTFHVWHSPQKIATWLPVSRVPARLQTAQWPLSWSEPS